MRNRNRAADARERAQPDWLQRTYQPNKVVATKDNPPKGGSGLIPPRSLQPAARPPLDSITSPAGAHGTEPDGK